MKKTFILTALFIAATLANAQSFKCKKDKLDSRTVQFSVAPSNLKIEQNCEISILNRKGKKVSGKNFELSIRNANTDHLVVRSNDLSFTVDDKSKGNPWLHLDGQGVEITGNMTITPPKCDLTYDFPFEIKQPFPFDKKIMCKGEKKEFAVAKYKNTSNNRLYVVLDIHTDELYLMESPFWIDASGVRGANGRNGSNGSSGRSGSSSKPNGGPGSNGDDGKDGAPGGNGGEIVVYLPKGASSNIVLINVDGGSGGLGGRGGSGGTGGLPHRVKVDGKWQDAGSQGPSGNHGNHGRDGRDGQKGVYSIEASNDIRTYFKNVNHPHFKIENIEQ